MKAGCMLAITRKIIIVFNTEIFRKKFFPDRYSSVLHLAKLEQKLLNITEVGKKFVVYAYKYILCL